MFYPVFELNVKNVVGNKTMLLVYSINTLGQVFEAVKHELGLSHNYAVFYNKKTKEFTDDMSKTVSEFGLNENIELEIAGRNANEASFFMCKRIVDDLKYLNIYKEDENVVDKAIEIRVHCKDNDKYINTYVMPSTPLKAISDGLFSVLHLLKGYEIIYECGGERTDNSNLTVKEFGLYAGSVLKITQKDYWKYMYIGSKDCK